MFSSRNQCEKKLGFCWFLGQGEAEIEICWSIAVRLILAYYYSYYLIFCYEMFQCICEKPDLLEFNKCLLHSLFAGLCSRCCGYRSRYYRHCPQRETEMLFGIPSGQSFVAAVSIDTQAIVITVTSCNSFGHGHAGRLDMQCPVSGHAIKLEPHCILYP